MKIKLTVLAFFISMVLSSQVLAFDVGGLSYSVINATNDAQVDGCAANPCSSSDIVIPDTVVDSGTTYGVTIIGDFAFDTSALTSVTIGNSVTTIGPYAFKEADRSRGLDRAGGEVNRVAFAVLPNQNAPGELQMPIRDTRA